MSNILVSLMTNQLHKYMDLCNRYGMFIYHNFRKLELAESKIHVSVSIKCKLQAMFSKSQAGIGVVYSSVF